MFVKIKKVEGCIVNVDDLKRRYPAFAGNRDFHGIPVVGQTYPLIETITVRIIPGKYLVCHVIGSPRNEIYCVPVDDCEVTDTDGTITSIPFGTGKATYKKGSDYVYLNYLDHKHSVHVRSVVTLYETLTQCK